MCEDVLRGVKRWVARSLFPPSTRISARLESLFTEFTVRCPQQPSGVGICEQVLGCMHSQVEDRSLELDQVSKSAKRRVADVSECDSAVECARM